MPDAPNWDDRRHWIDYDSACALRYHGRRRDFLDRLARLDPAASLMLGSTAFATVVSGHLHIAAVAAALSAGFSAVNITFGLSERARLHESLCRRWGELRAKLARLAEDDEEGLRNLEVERTLIDSDSPDQLRALSTICENEEKRARHSGALYRVGWLQRSVADFFTFPWWKSAQEAAGSLDANPAVAS